MEWARRRRRRTGAARCCSRCGRRHRTRSRHSKPTLHGARVLDTISRATSIVWWRVAPGSDACPSCVAVLQRRLRHDASELPSEQRTRWDERLQHAARAVRGRGAAVAARGNRAIRRGHGRALHGKTRGATLIKQDGAARTTGSGLGQGRAAARAGTEVREVRGRPRDRDRGHRFRRRFQESLDIMRSSGFQGGNPSTGLCSGFHDRKTKTPFFACSGMRPWTPVMTFPTDVTPAHEFGSMKDPLPSKTHDVTFVSHS